MRIGTCFISASFEADTRQIRASLQQRGVRELGITDVKPGELIPIVIKKSIISADLMVAVVTQRDSSWAMFALGIAAAMGKPTLVFAPAKSDIVPFDLQSFQVVRTSLQNREAIDFAFDQLLASSDHSKPAGTLPLAPRERRLLEASNYQKQLELLMQVKGEGDLGRLVANAIRESGAELVVEAPSDSHVIDFVVWSDELQPFVGNPFPIEIKQRLKSPDHTKQSLSLVARAATSIGSAWSMLLFAEGPSSDDEVWRSQPRVLALSIRQLFDQLAASSFAEIIIDLRNRRANGGFFA